jgi:uncharacterized membrane protein
MPSFIYWYLLITLLGLLAFPLTYKLLPGLADRGYTLARILGLLIWGYLFWLLGSLGVLANNTAAEVFTLLLVAMLCYLAWRTLDMVQFRTWFRQQSRMILVVEALFLFTFIAWAILRSANSDIVGTEKPMELAFINAMLRSSTLPPHDPWLSGHTISYYYFGYVMIAMVARLTGTLGGVAFNLGVSLIFALTAIGAYGVLYNLLSVCHRRESGTKISLPRSPFTPLIAPFFVLIVSNLSGMLQLMRINGIFWRKTYNGEWVSPFWSWLDIGSLSAPPSESGFNQWWWWQGSRIIQDYDFLWNKKEGVIDEFPFFSFLLADLHPHLIALPFGLLAMALALNLWAGGSLRETRCLGIRLDLELPSYGLAAFALGALGFINTWDFPFYVALFAGVYVFKRINDNHRTDTELKPFLTKSTKDFFMMGFTLTATGVLAFLPFYLSFSSQAGGLTPNLIYITKGVYLWIMFAPLLLPILGLLIYLWSLYGDRQRLIIGIKASLVILAILSLVTVTLTALISSGAIFEEVNTQASVKTSAFLNSLNAPGFKELIFEAIVRRLHTPGTFLTLTSILVMVIALLWPLRTTRPMDQELHSLTTANTFALILVLLGAILILIPEFFYLRDFFGYRINTIFKFYFLAWVVWSIAAAYGMIVVWNKLSGISAFLYKTFSSTVIILALLFPVMSVWSKTNGFKPRHWELDGTMYFKRNNPNEAAAIQWLGDSPFGIVAESVGSSYSTHARIATHSGLPTVLGWIGHEHQWRGSFEKIGSREDDIARLYCSTNWQETRSTLKKYDIRYIMVGELERKTYVPASRSCESGLNEAKFIEYLTLAFQRGDVSVYENP